MKDLIINKSAFPFYTDYWQQYFSRLSGEQCKEVLRIICQFNQSGEQEKHQDFAVDMVANCIITNVIRDAKKREKRIAASQNNGSKGGRPPKSEKKPRKTDAKPKETQSVIKEINIPDFIDKDLLNDFFAFRESIANTKKPFTLRAKQLILKDLVKFEAIQTGFANLSLENAIKNSWLGVFEPKRNNQSSDQNNQQEGGKLQPLVDFVNKIGRHTFIKKITQNQQEKPVFHFGNETDFENLKKLSTEDKDLIREEIFKFCGWREFNPRF